MPRVLLVLSVLFAAPACQKAVASRPPLSARDRQVAARLDALDTRVRHLRSRDQRLARRAAHNAGAVASLTRRLEAAVATLAHLKDKIGTVDSAAGDAASAASSAAEQAAELARRLAVLEKRFEYHLKHDPGST